MATTARGSKLDAKDVVKRAREEDVKTIRLQFTDILGGLKNVEIPAVHLERALDVGVWFDGSSIEGFVRIEESDMILRPDPSTYAVLPWKPVEHREARLICDVYKPDNSPFEGDPRGFLRRMIERARKLGFEMMAGPEAEFFLFQRDPDGRAHPITHDHAGYFDMTPADRGEDCRRDMVRDLVQLGFDIEAAHHEVANGQHEIDFKYADALSTADNVATFRMVVKTVALAHGLHATFMPKPVHGMNGSGMHCHQSLSKGSKNAFYEEKDELGLSKVCRHYMGGLLKHARGFTALCNPLVNSYKRLIPGFEAPIYVTWAEKNRSPMVRVPAAREEGTRIEVRSPDPSCNPYLALGAMLAAGLDGIEQGYDPGPPVNRNLHVIGAEERERMGIASLPGSLEEAVEALDADPFLREALGSHIYHNFREAKLREWAEYRQQVHQWELDSYLKKY